VRLTAQRVQAAQQGGRQRGCAPLQQAFGQGLAQLSAFVGIIAGFWLWRIDLAGQHRLDAPADPAPATQFLLRGRQNFTINADLKLRISKPLFFNHVISPALNLNTPTKPAFLQLSQCFQ